MTLVLVPESANGRSGPSKYGKPYRAPRRISASWSLFRGAIQPGGGQGLPEPRPLLVAERLEDHRLVDVRRQRPQPLAGGQIEEVAEQPLRRQARVGLILPERGDQVGQPPGCRLAAQTRRVGPARRDVAEQLHHLPDRGQLRERPEEQPPARVLVPPLDRVARHRVDQLLSRVDVPQGVVEQLPGMLMPIGNRRRRSARPPRGPVPDRPAPLPPRRHRRQDPAHSAPPDRRPRLPPALIAAGRSVFMRSPRRWSLPIGLWSISEQSPTLTCGLVSSRNDLAAERAV